MLIDWNNFTPWSALAGGGLIGIAAAIFILFNGRIAGITGIAGGLIRPKKETLAGESLLFWGWFSPRSYGNYSARFH